MRSLSCLTAAWPTQSLARVSSQLPVHHSVYNCCAATTPERPPPFSPSPWPPCQPLVPCSRNSSSRMAKPRKLWPGGPQAWRWMEGPPTHGLLVEGTPTHHASLTPGQFARSLLVCRFVPFLSIRRVPKRARAVACLSLALKCCACRLLGPLNERGVPSSHLGTTRHIRSLIVNSSRNSLSSLNLKSNVLHVPLCMPALAIDLLHHPAC